VYSVFSAVFEASDSGRYRKAGDAMGIL